MPIASPYGVCGRRRVKGTELDADEAGRLLDCGLDGVGGFESTSKSNAEYCDEYCEEVAAADALSKPAKYENGSEVMFIAAEDVPACEVKNWLDGRADDIPIEAAVCRTRGVTSLKNESGEIMPLSRSGVRGSIEEANERCRDTVSYSAVSSVVEDQFEKRLLRVGRSNRSSMTSCSNSGVGGTEDSDMSPVTRTGGGATVMSRACVKRRRPSA
jgi:hypothetical protein